MKTTIWQLAHRVRVGGRWWTYEHPTVFETRESALDMATWMQRENGSLYFGERWYAKKLRLYHR